MKHILLWVFAWLLFLPAQATFANDRCPLTGNVYVFQIDDTSFELSGFECTFGPGCSSNCDLWYGNFDTGPRYYAILPFSCEQNGNAVIAGCPCALTENGDLKCLLTDISGYHRYELGGTVYYVPDKTNTFTFEVAPN